MNIKYFINNPKHFIIGVLSKLGPLVPDKLYLQICYKLNTGKKINLKDPHTYNEKLQWLKIYDRNPLYTVMVDKYAVKDYVANIIGDKHIIPLLGVWDKFDEIDFDLLPDRFVLKTTHDSGGIVICKNKKEFDIEKAREEIKKHLNKKMYYLTREWPYKKVPPRIIAERYIVDESGYELKDYKVFVFNGIPKLIQVDYGRYKNHKRNVYTTDWEYLDVRIKYINDYCCKITKPNKLEEMLSISSILAKNIPHVRVDFYVVKDDIYFGELTFYHGSGLEDISPESFAYKMGEWIKLPCIKNNG